MKNGVFDQYFALSKTVQNTTMVTVEDEHELVCDLSNGPIFGHHILKVK